MTHLPSRQSVLITGASGFTGRYLAQELRREGYVVHGLVRGEALLPQYHEVHRAELEDTEALRRIVEAVRPHHVVHLAAISFVAHGNIDEIYQVNVLGARHLLEALVVSGLRFNSVLLASSANVYGNARVDPLTEEVAPQPANDYAVSKLAMEFVASLYRDRLPLIVVRPFNYTGVGQALSFLLPKIVDHFRRRAAVIELGNLDVARDFSDVRAVVQIYRRLLEAPEALGGTFNVCSGRVYTLQEVLDMAQAITGHSIEVRVNPAFVRANEVKVLRGSPERLVQALGEIPWIELEETLRWMLEAPSLPF